MSNVVEYYNDFYNENERLGENCDNRLLTEKIVKQHIISKYIKEGDSLLEIGVGAGIHSIYFSKIGCDVSACDIVPKHVELIEYNARSNNVEIDASVQDALNLKYDDNKFDIVLLSGPIYHLNSLSDKEKAIMEAKRVCKSGGIVVIDYLPRLHSFIQQILRFPEFLKDLSTEDIDDLNCKDKIFSFDDSHDIKSLVEKCGFEIRSVFSTDSITRFISDKINSLDKSELDKWIRVIMKINDYDVVDLGEHALIIAVNR